MINHVLLVAEENSEVTYLENYYSANANKESVANLVSEVFAHQNAKVSYGAVDHLAEGTTAYVNRRGVADRDANIEWALGQMNDGNTISDNTTHLKVTILSVMQSPFLLVVENKDRTSQRRL